MRVNNLIPKIFVGTLMIATICSHAQNAPTLPSIPLPVSMTNTAAEVKDLNSSKGLSYRDSSKPLTIGEVSELQAKKANAEIYKKYGLTDVPQSKPASKTEVAAPQPKLEITVLAIWGKPGELRSEALVGGTLRRLPDGKPLYKDVNLKAVRPWGLEIEKSSTEPVKRTNHAKQIPKDGQVARAESPAKKSHGRKMASEPVEPTLIITRYTAAVGHTLEVKL